MYIMHVPLFFWMNTVAMRLFGLKPAGLGWMLCYVVVVVCVSCVLFKALEQPANRILKMRLSPRPGRSPRKDTMDEEACSSPSR